MLCRFTGAINRINSHVQGYVEAHSKGRIKFVDCRSFFLSESEDIDEDLMPDSAYPNASGVPSNSLGVPPSDEFLSICALVLIPGDVLWHPTACLDNGNGYLACHIIAG